MWNPFVLVLVFVIRSIFCETGLDVTSKFISERLFKKLQDCKIYAVLGNFRDIDSNERLSWLKTFEELTSDKNLQKYSGGIINLDNSIILQNKTNNPISIVRPTRMYSDSCSAIFILLPTKILESDEFELTKILTKPILNPATFKNTDKYIFITKKNNLNSLYDSKLISSIKYKLIITEAKDGQVHGHSFCPYCPQGPIQNTILNRDSETGVDEYFPDLQRNYYGSILKFAASDKVPINLEIVKEGEKYIAKRGVYASVLMHLMKKLNFTYEARISSGGASTGHQLANKTWVGTVGDTFNGIVDFGFMADVTYQRFSIVELCATINYAFLGFGSGPPARIYTWKAIFWPFSISMWAGIIIAILLSAIIASLIVDNPHFEHLAAQNKSRNLKKSRNPILIIQHFLKLLIEQGDDFPSRSNSARVFFGCWLFFAIVATTAYKSKILSFMMFPVVEKVPESFEELAQSEFEIDFHYFGNVAFNLFRTSTSPTFVSIYQQMRKEPDPLKCLERTLIAKSVCIIFINTYQLLRSKNLSDRNGNSPVSFQIHNGFMWTPGVVTEKKSALSSNFKRVINTAMEMSLLAEWKRSDLKEIQRNTTASKKKAKSGSILESHFTEDSSDVLRLHNLIGSFTVLVVGIIIAFVTFIGEKICHCYQIYCKRIAVRLEVISLVRVSVAKDETSPRII